MPANGTGASVDPNRLLLIRAADAQAALDYLTKQPCGEVYDLVTVLLNLREATNADAPPAPAES